MHTILHLILWAIVTYFGINGAKTFQQRIAGRHISRIHRCMPARRERPWDVLGIVKVCIVTRNMVSSSMIPYIMSLFKIYGETYEVRIFNTRLIMTCDPRNLRQIQYTRFDDYNTAKGVREGLMRPLFSHSIFAIDGVEWKEARPLYRELLSSTKRILDINLYERVFQDLKRSIPTDGTQVDLHPLFLNFMLDVTMGWLLGFQGDMLSGKKSPECKELVDAMCYATRFMARDGYLPWLRPFLRRKKLHAACSLLQGTIDRSIDEAMELHTHKDDDGNVQRPSGLKPLVDTMLQYTTDRIVLRDTALTLLIAGTDSVVSVLASTFWLLARHEHEYQRVREEIVRIAGEEPPTLEQLGKAKHLRNVLNEVLRLYVPIPYNAKLANTATWLPVGGGPDGQSSVVVHEGDYIIYSPWASHRREAAFGDDAEDFRPDRWDELKPEQLAGYIPFNIGPRSCPGQKFALAQVEYVAARLIQTYPTLSTRDGRKWVEKIGDSFNVTNKYGTLVSFTNKGATGSTYK